MRSGLRFAYVNDDHKTFTCIFPSHYCVFQCNPVSLVLSRPNLALSLGSATTCSGYRYIAVSGLPADPDFDTRHVAVFDHSSEDRIIFKHKFTQHILSMRITPKILIVAFYSRVDIWDIETKTQLSSMETGVNVRAPVDVSAGDTTCVAFTGRDTSMIAVYKIQNVDIRSVQAADAAVSLIRFSRNGALLASTSANGKVVWIISTADCKCVGKFKRGNTVSVIHSIEFSPCSRFLAIASKNGTIHFFDLSVCKSSSSPPSMRSFHTISLGHAVTAHLAWGEPGVLSVMTMDGQIMNISIDPVECVEVGRQNVKFIRRALEQSTVVV